MKNQVEKWLSKKKNQRMLLTILGFICLYFYFKNRAKNSGPSYIGLKGTYIGGSASPVPNQGGTSGTVTPYPPSNGTMSPKLADYGYPGHINLVVTGNSGKWSIVDTADVPVPPGYQIRYYINSGEMIISSTPLMGYTWESNFPITITKCLIKEGVEDLYFWGTNEPELIKEEDGAPMPGNTSMAYQTYIFNRY